LEKSLTCKWVLLVGPGKHVVVAM